MIDHSEPRYITCRVEGGRHGGTEESSRCIHQHRLARHPADLAAGQLDLHPAAALEPPPRLDAAMDRRVVARREGPAVAAAKQHAIPRDHYERMRVLLLFLPRPRE